VPETASFAFSVCALNAQRAQVVFAVIGGNVADLGDSLVVCRAHKGVNGKAVELLVRRGISDQGANALRQGVEVAHRCPPGGGFTGVVGFGADGVVVVAGLVAAAGDVGAAAVAGSIRTPVA